MQETPSLQEMLAETVRAYCAQDGGGIPLGFVFAIHRIDNSGAERIHVGCLDGQSALVSAGLVGYLDATVRVEIEDDLFAVDDSEDED